MRIQNNRPSVNIPLDILNVEAFVWPTVFETAGEICLRYVKEGKKVGFVYLGDNNPDDEEYQGTRSFGPKKQRKARQYSKLIRREGVVIIKPIEISQVVFRQIEELSQKSFKDIHELKLFKYKDANIGLGVASSLISETRDPDPCLSNHAKRIATFLLESLCAFERTISLIELYQPKTLLTFNGRFALSRSVVEAARVKNIEVIYHERGADMNHFRIQNKPIHDLSYIRTSIIDSWGNGGAEKESLAHTFFKRRRQGDGIGWKSFIDMQVQGVIPKKVKNKRIVYFSSSDDERAAISDMISNILFPSQRDAVCWLLNFILEKQDTELIIRLHPNKSTVSEKERSWWEGLRTENVMVISPEASVDSYSLAESADVVVSYGSTIGIEASYWGTPSIMLGDAQYRGMGCMYEPTSLHNLAELLNENNLPPLPREKCLPYGYYGVSKGQSFIYYKPETFFSGEFLGVRLSTDIPGMHYLRRMKFYFQNLITKTT